MQPKVQLIRTATLIASLFGIAKNAASAVAVSDRESTDAMAQFHESKKRREFFKSTIWNMSLPNSSFDAHPEFEKFVMAFDRMYEREYNVSEYVVRLGFFANTLKMIKERNAQELKSNRSRVARHGITKFADWSREEFSALLGLKVEDSRADTEANVASMSTTWAAPCSKSWESRAFVRNQGACGDCFAFSAVETLRAAYIEEHGTDPGRLSTQFIADCQQQQTCSGGVNGCCGGLPLTSLEWIKEQGGIPTQQAYGDTIEQVQAGSFSESGPLPGPVSHTGEGITLSGNNPTKPYACKADVPKAVTLTEAVQLRGENEMANHVCNAGTLSIGVDASAWQTYVGGVMTAFSCGTTIDHAVAIAGISQSDNAWIVQNSWGTDWGITIEGEDVPKDRYSNCPSLSEQYGCFQELEGGETVGQVCALSCSDGKAVRGGFIMLAYGENTCGISSIPVYVSGTVAVSSELATKSKDDASTETTTSINSTSNDSAMASSEAQQIGRVLGLLCLLLHMLGKDV